MDINMIDDIISLLMRRDAISEEEARSAVRECRAKINEVLCGETMDFGVYDEVVDIIGTELGLEPDYIDVILGY